MSRIHWLLILVLAVAVPAMTQESEEGGSAEAPATADELAEPEAADEADDTEGAEDEGASEVFDLDDPEDADLDEQTYEEDEDVFVPTEEIPSDEPIPFPTNI